jgi:hypothetical protein
MANEIQHAHSASGASLYAIVRDNGANVYDGSTFESYDAGHYGSYALPMSEIGASRYYVGTFPSVDPGSYRIAVYVQSAGSPAEGDALVDHFALVWDGAQPINVPSLFEALFELLPASLTDGGMQATVIEIAGGVSSALADAILDRTAGVETGITLRQALRLILASAAGPLSGADTSSISIKAADNSKTRIVASVDASGNRTSVSLDPT